MMESGCSVLSDNVSCESEIILKNVTSLRNNCPSQNDFGENSKDSSSFDLNKNSESYFEINNGLSVNGRVCPGEGRDSEPAQPFLIKVRNEKSLTGGLVSKGGAVTRIEDDMPEAIVLSESDSDTASADTNGITNDDCSAVDSPSTLHQSKQRKSTSTPDVEILSEMTSPNLANQMRNKISSMRKKANLMEPVEIKDVEPALRECFQCNKTKSCPLSVDINGTTCYLCSDVCSIENKYVQISSLQRCNLKSFELNKTKLQRKCAQCHQKVKPTENNLSWETMEFCNEICLKTYHNSLGQNCSNCWKVCAEQSLGKYCVRFGFQVKQFCQASCLEEFKKGLKLCSFCQEDIQNGHSRVTNQQSKEFCSEECLSKYDRTYCSNPIRLNASNCNVCNKFKLVAVEVLQGVKQFYLCSDVCFNAWKFVESKNLGFCDLCKKYFDEGHLKAYESYSTFFEENPYTFCSKTCMNLFVLVKRKIVQCNWCKVKKYNFDMIKRTFGNKQVMMLCSFHCFNLWKQSPKRSTCDHCNKFGAIFFHLGMSDGTVRSFCGNKCLMSFQIHFKKIPVTPSQAVDISQPTKADQVKSGVSTVAAAAPQIRVEETAAEPELVPTPVVVNQTPSPNPTTPQARKTTSVLMNKKQASTIQLPQNIVRHQILMIPPAPVKSANKSTYINIVPVNRSKGVECKPNTTSRESQTDYLEEECASDRCSSQLTCTETMEISDGEENETRNTVITKNSEYIVETTGEESASVLSVGLSIANVKKSIANALASCQPNQTDDSTKYIPVPVPLFFFIPVPVPMYDVPVPIPVPIPVPLPIPLTVPSLSNSEEEVIQQLEESHEVTTGTVQTEIQETDSFEAAMQGKKRTLSIMEEIEESGVSQTEEGSNNKRQKLSEEREERRESQCGGGGDQSHGEAGGGHPAGSGGAPAGGPPPPSTNPLSTNPPNKYFKHMLGVNAWKDWVVKKNMEIEKGQEPKRSKPFGTELLLLTSDEICLSLCMFINEYRKPSGEEFSPDVLYFLCLGIQDYLQMNGRNDNIFADGFYEKFTDSLDELIKRHSSFTNRELRFARIEQEHLWETKQLGPFSPFAVLVTLMFFNTKYFLLNTVNDHIKLSFSHIMKLWKRSPSSSDGLTTVKNTVLRYYPPNQPKPLCADLSKDSSEDKKKLEQHEDTSNPYRCPVRIYEYYLSKCPESVKNRNDEFYLQPERSYTPDSPVWYTTEPLDRKTVSKIFNRLKLVKELSECFTNLQDSQE